MEWWSIGMLGKHHSITPSGQESKTVVARSIARLAHPAFQNGMPGTLAHRCSIFTLSMKNAVFLELSALKSM
jgi:hypothetical protein